MRTVELVHADGITIDAEVDGTITVRSRRPIVATIASIVSSAIIIFASSGSRKEYFRNV